MAMPRRPIVLILSSDPAFSRQLMESWLADTDLPEFVVLEGDLGRELDRDAFDLAIADGCLPSRRDSLEHALAGAGKPAIVIRSDEPVDSHDIHSRILQLPREPKQWMLTAVLLGREILRRSTAESRTRASELAQAAVEAEATLGRYILEMRNNVNNAITSVLGNAELLLLEPGLPAPVQVQADTIRNMALRLNEVFQRFSSIEKELNVAAREAEKKSDRARAAAGGR